MTLSEYSATNGLVMWSITVGFMGRSGWSLYDENVVQYGLVFSLK